MQFVGFEAHTLLDEAEVTVKLLRFEAGHELKQHQSSKPIAIQVLSGEGEFLTRGQTHNLERGSYLSLASSEPHAVRAVSPLELLLTIHKGSGPNAPLRVIRPNEGQASPAHPLDILLECHRRNAQFVRVLNLLVQQPPKAALEKHELSALELALRFFMEVRPLHHADEEDSLFSRLTNTYLAKWLRLLSAEHARLDQLHGHLQVHLEAWIGEGRLDAQQRRHLESILQELSVILGKHREIEEEEIFPFAKQTLGADTWEQIDQEFAARRR